MNEVDDRLAGDPVWELFPAHSSESAPGSRPLRFMWWLTVGCMVSASMVFSPSLAVLIASLAIAAGDFQRGRQLARSIPDKAGGDDLFAVHLRLGCMEGRTCGLCLSVHDRDPGPFGA